MSSVNNTFEALLPGEQLAFQQIERLFSTLSDEQKSKLLALNELYRAWNEKINLISRKDIDNLYAHHILHSVGVCKMLHFAPGSIIADAGTGGGFPGIPLAILFPQCKFILIDSIGKKVKVCENIADELSLNNVTCMHSRLEESGVKCHFVVSRAAMALKDLVSFSKKVFLKENINALPNGIIALKGGNLDGEIAFARKRILVEELQDYLNDPYYKEKRVLYYPIH